MRRRRRSRPRYSGGRGVWRLLGYALSPPRRTLAARTSSRRWNSPAPPEAAGGASARASRPASPIDSMAARRSLGTCPATPIRSSWRRAPSCPARSIELSADGPMRAPYAVYPAGRPDLRPRPHRPLPGAGGHAEKGHVCNWRKTAPIAQSFGGHIPSRRRIAFLWEGIFVKEQTRVKDHPSAAGGAADGGVEACGRSRGPQNGSTLPKRRMDFPGCCGRIG